ncbi:MAG TPA: DRTGG domain-containing protein [Patescibacteria group bacterium]|nr:DRTGG domain-containing protein [Patescibacteria group bacterium]
MKINEIKELLCAEILCGEELLGCEVNYAFGSDLMSDVLAYVKGQTVLLTGLTNTQVIRTAEMAELNAVIFVRGKRPDQDLVTLARENNIVLMMTRDTLYTASGKLYCKGLDGVQIEC